MSKKVIFKELTLAEIEAREKDAKSIIEYDETSDRGIEFQKCKVEECEGDALCIQIDGFESHILLFGYQITRLKDFLDNVNEIRL
jgi:hypothetical protein